MNNNISQLNRQQQFSETTIAADQALQLTKAHNSSTINVFCEQLAASYPAHVVINHIDGVHTKPLEQTANHVLVVDACYSPSANNYHCTQPVHSLIIVHSVDQPCPKATTAWLKAVNPQAHYHARKGDAGDLRRISRLLSGRPNVLVLSGGAARGLAHVGVLRALLETDTEIDLVAGTSMGALIGAAFAAGINIDAIEDFIRHFSKPRRLLDYTLPLTALLASKKINQLLRQIFSEAHIEHTLLPFLCVSTNLSLAEPVIHQRGSLWQALRASTAMPGIFSPVTQNGDVLIDGGIMNNFPVDLVRARFPHSHIIGVNVTPFRISQRRYQFGHELCGWRLLWQRLNPFTHSTPTPSLIGGLFRAMQVNNLHQDKRKRYLVDTLIEPDLSGVKMLDFQRHDTLFECGYQAARLVFAAAPDSEQSQPQQATTAARKQRINLLHERVLLAS